MLGQVFVDEQARCSGMWHLGLPSCTHVSMPCRQFVLPCLVPPPCTKALVLALSPGADPAQRLSVEQVLHHPWCSQGLQPGTLTFNDMMVARSLAEQPTPQVA